MKVQCLCETKFEVTPIIKLNLDEDEKSLNKIKDGTFNSFKCPSCGYKLRAEAEVEIIWKSKNTSIVFIPESKRMNCLSICAGDLKPKKSNKTSLQFNKKMSPVIGFAELVDRIKVVEVNLDPTGIEIVKFIVLQNANAVNKNSLEIFFNQIQDDKLEFLISGLKEDEVAIIKVPKKIYDDILIDYKKNKNNELFSAIHLGNYISYKNIYMEGETND